MQALATKMPATVDQQIADEFEGLIKSLNKDTTDSYLPKILSRRQTLLIIDQCLQILRTDAHQCLIFEQVQKRLDQYAKCTRSTKHSPGKTKGNRHSIK
jgi:hypothetical protein